MHWEVIDLTLDLTTGLHNKVLTSACMLELCTSVLPLENLECNGLC